MTALAISTWLEYRLRGRGDINAHELRQIATQTRAQPGQRGRK